MDGGTGLWGGFSQSELNLRSAWPILTLDLNKNPPAQCIMIVRWRTSETETRTKKRKSECVGLARPTHSLFLFFSLSPPLSLWRTRSPSFCLLFPVILLGPLFHTHTHTSYNPFWMGEGVREVCHEVWFSWYLLIKNTVSFHVSKDIHLFKHTPSHTMSSLSTIK